MRNLLRTRKQLVREQFSTDSASTVIAKQNQRSDLDLVAILLYGDASCGYVGGYNLKISLSGQRHRGLRDSAGTGAPGDEIEVIPPMIEAGVREYVKADDDFDSGADIVTTIYRAMAAARAASKMR